MSGPAPPPSAKHLRFERAWAVRLAWFAGQGVAPAARELREGESPHANEVYAYVYASPAYVDRLLELLRLGADLEARARSAGGSP